MRIDVDDGGGGSSLASPLVVRASLHASAYGMGAPCGAQLIGTDGALARNGSAHLQGLMLRALKVRQRSAAARCTAGHLIHVLVH